MGSLDEGVDIGTIAEMRGRRGKFNVILVAQLAEATAIGCWADFLTCTTWAGRGLADSER